MSKSERLSLKQLINKTSWNIKRMFVDFFSLTDWSYNVWLRTIFSKPFYVSIQESFFRRDMYEFIGLPGGGFSPSIVLSTVLWWNSLSWRKKCPVKSHSRRFMTFIVDIVYPTLVSTFYFLFSELFLTGRNYVICNNKYILIRYPFPSVYFFRSHHISKAASDLFSRIINNPYLAAI